MLHRVISTPNTRTETKSYLEISSDSKLNKSSHQMIFFAPAFVQTQSFVII